MTLRPLALISAATIALAAPGAAQQTTQAKPQSSLAPAQQGNWSATVTRTERGHLLGNPKAETRLIEFISYTCPHCAQFAMEGDPAIELTLLGPGKLAVEVRPVIRNALDLTVTLLVQCGDPAGFKERHRAFMYGQKEWLAKFMAAPQSQQAIWARGDKASRMNAASALGLGDMMVQRGQSLAEVNACVSNDAAAQKLIETGMADRTEFNIAGTPSFAMDGKLLSEVYDWSSLYPVLSARFAAPTP